MKNGSRRQQAFLQFVSTSFGLLVSNEKSHIYHQQSTFLSINSVVGVQNTSNDGCISLGIIKNWTHDHVNVLILPVDTNQQTNEMKTASIPWMDIFFCLPYNCPKNNYTFTFINTLNPTKFHACCVQTLKINGIQFVILLMN